MPAPIDSLLTTLGLDEAWLAAAYAKNIADLRALAKTGRDCEEAAAPTAPHAKSRFLCDQHGMETDRCSSRRVPADAVVAGGLWLPEDRFCGVCARLLINKTGSLEYEQVAEVCCLVMCAHCAAEKFVGDLQVGMKCEICSKEVIEWKVLCTAGAPERTVRVPPPITWRQYPSQREMHEDDRGPACKSGDKSLAPLAASAASYGGDPTGKDFPHGWKECKAPDGRPYFINHNMGESTCPPPELANKMVAKGVRFAQTESISSEILPLLNPVLHAVTGIGLAAACQSLPEDPRMGSQITAHAAPSPAPSGLHFHRRQSALAEEALLSLTTLAGSRNTDQLPNIVSHGGVQRILGAMEANLKHSGVQAAGCSVLKAGKNSDAVIGWAEALAWAGNAERGSTRAQGETAEVQSLLDGGMKPSIPNSASQTALHVGAALGGGGGWGETAAHAQAVKNLTEALKTLKNGSTPAVAGAGGDWQSAVHAESGGTYYWDRKTNLTNWARPMAWAGASDCAGHSAGETLLLSGDLLCETKEISYAKQKRCQRDEKVQLQAKLDRLLPQDARQRGFKSAGHRSAGVCGRSFLNTLTDTINHVRKLKAEVSYRDVLMSAKTLVAMEVELQGDELVIQTLGAGAQDWFANAPWEVCKGILLRELVQKDHWSSLQQLKDALQASTVARSGLSRKNLWLDVQLSRFQTSKYISDQMEQTKPDATVMHRSVTSTSITTSLVRTVEYVCAKLEVAISSTPEQQRTHKRKRMEDDTNIQVADVLDSPLASGSNALGATPRPAANHPHAILLFNMPASWQWSPLQPIATKATREPGSQEPSDPSKTIGRWIHVESMSASSLPAHQESERVHVHKPRAVHALFCKRD